MKESHFQGLEESSYLGEEGENALIFFFLFGYSCQQSKVEKINERNPRENGGPLSSSRGPLRIGTLPAPRTLPGFSPPAQTHSPIPL